MRALSPELSPSLLGSLLRAPTAWSVLRISNRAAKALARCGLLEMRAIRVEGVAGGEPAKILRGRLTPAGRALLPFARSAVRASTPVA